MKYIVFDTETTGFAATDEVFQFAGLVLNDKLDLQQVVNFYCFSQVLISPGAMQVTGVDNRQLRRLSAGLYFEDHYYKLGIFKEEDVVWVGYNVQFDIGMINNTLRNNGLAVHSFGTPISRIGITEGIHNFDVMRMLSDRNGMKQKLGVAAKEHLHYTERTLDAMYKKLLKLANLNTNMKQHNALYDAMLTWLLFYEYGGGTR